MTKSAVKKPKFNLSVFFRSLGGAIASGTNDLLTAAGHGIQNTWAFVESWLLDSKKARYGLAITRILLGVSAIGLLLSNFSTRLYSFGSGSLWNGEGLEAKSDFPKIWIFSSFHEAMSNDLVYTLLYLLLLALAVAFTLGWRTRIVHPALFILWVSFIEANDMLGDQGDNMYRIALFWMLFADPAGRLSLDARRKRRKGEVEDPQKPWTQAATLLHNLVLVILTAQVSFVYVSGALYKAGGDPWSGGYAVYNPLMTDRFGTWPWLSEVVTTWGPAVTIAAWGSILLQLSFPFLLLTRPTRIIGLVGILGFHIAIAVLMGLPWFSLAMIAIDAIFIRDRTWRAMTVGFLERFRSSQARITGEAPPGDAAAADADADADAEAEAEQDTAPAEAAGYRRRSARVSS
ncbi:HTTM domain-containing protein [Microbacterium sp. NC79]|uniref:HTTM domain-containing protein n=1 Tax=Microbacterium sp. NC79 TaxID=2851009 RepID=UPI00349F4286